MLSPTDLPLVEHHLLMGLLLPAHPRRRRILEPTRSSEGGRRPAVSVRLGVGLGGSVRVPVVERRGRVQRGRRLRGRRRRLLLLLAKVHGRVGRRRGGVLVLGCLVIVLVLVPLGEERHGLLARRGGGRETGRREEARDGGRVGLRVRPSEGWPETEGTLKS